MTAVVDHPSFSYSILSRTKQKAVQRGVKSIRRGMRDQVRGIMRTGQELIIIKELVGHDNFGGWLKYEFGWTERTAQNYMAVFRQFKGEPVSDLIALKALYMLASDSAPAAAREEALARISGGQRVTQSDAKALIEQHKIIALPATTGPAANPPVQLRFQPGMVAHCSRCKIHFGSPDPFGPVYDFEQWKLESSNLWRCPNGSGHRTADPILNIIAKESPASVFALATGMKLLYASKRGITCHLAQPGASHTLCDELVNYLTDRPRANVAYRPCENCAKAAWKLIGPTENAQPPAATEDGVQLRYDPAERAWCGRCIDWQHFILIGQDTWQCKVCGVRVQDDVIEPWSPEADEELKRGRPSRWSKGNPPASKSVAAASTFIPGSGALPPVSAPPVVSLPKFKVILADPPWQYEKYADPDGRGTAEAHYPVMSLPEIRALPVAGLADDDCALFMWVTWPVMDQAFSVAAAWGFQYKTAALVWAKTNKRAADRMSIVTSDSNWFFGMGSWTRANTETCLLFTKGQPQRVNADVRQLIVAPVSEHSRKPDEQYERIERLLKGPYVELFARRERAGWTSWGLEIEGGSVTFPAAEMGAAR